MSKNREIQEMRSLEEYVRNLRKDMDRKLEDLKVQMNVVQQKATTQVTQRPLLALGVAFVAGMALGVALSKASD